MNEPPLLPPKGSTPPANEPPLLPPQIPPVLPPPPEPDEPSEGSVLAGLGLWLAVLFATVAMLRENMIFLSLPLVSLVAGGVWVAKHGWNRTATGVTIAALLTLGFGLLIWSICSGYHYQG